MNSSKHVNLQAQRGISLSGLIVGLGVIFFIAVLGMRIFPSFLEYRSAKDGIASAKRTGGTPKEMRTSFNKHAEINTITSINGSDLIITKNGAGENELSFDYENKISLFEGVYLGINYKGTTDKSGIIPEKPDTPIQ